MPPRVAVPRGLVESATMKAPAPGWLRAARELVSPSWGRYRVLRVGAWQVPVRLMFS